MAEGSLCYVAGEANILLKTKLTHLECEDLLDCSFQLLKVSRRWFRFFCEVQVDLCVDSNKRLCFNRHVQLSVSSALIEPAFPDFMAHSCLHLIYYIIMFLFLLLLRCLTPKSAWLAHLVFKIGERPFRQSNRASNEMKAAETSAKPAQSR